EWQIYEKSTSEKIKAADRFRQEGNEAYRKNNYGLASVHYRKALLQFDYTFADTPEEEKQVEDVKLPCLLNLAACKCQQEEWDEVLTQCRLALEVNPRSVKAFYRSGLAHLARDNFELAKDTLTSALEIEGKNPEVLAALRQLRKNMEDYKVRRREVAAAMVSGEGGEPTEADGAGEVPESDVLQCAATSEQDRTEASEDEADTSADEMPAEVESTLRKRRPHVGSSEAEAKEKEADVDEDAEEDAEALGLEQRKTLNCLLTAAACLGVVSVSACVLAFSSAG
ncbi:unnamed protein product, partial [Polarella glacialis]